MSKLVITKEYLIPEGIETLEQIIESGNPLSLLNTSTQIVEDKEPMPELFSEEEADDNSKEDTLERIIKSGKKLKLERYAEDPELRLSSEKEYLEEDLNKLADKLEKESELKKESISYDKLTLIKDILEYVEEKALFPEVAIISKEYLYNEVYSLEQFKERINSLFSDFNMFYSSFEIMLELTEKVDEMLKI